MLLETVIQRKKYKQCLLTNMTYWYSKIENKDSSQFMHQEVSHSVDFIQNNAKNNVIYY